VKFKRLTDRVIADYVASGDCKGRVGAFVTGINGTYTAIVGLPLRETKPCLTGLGGASSVASVQASKFFAD
jgi:septum formation protein